MSQPPPPPPPENDDIYYPTHHHNQSHNQQPPPATFTPYPSLRLNPVRDHHSENYEDMQLDHYPPLLLSSLERHLPNRMLNRPREEKAEYMTNILNKYYPLNEHIRMQKQREYRQKIISSYPPLHKEIYSMHAENFFVPSFLEAIQGKSEASLRRVIAEPFKGIFTFQMLQPGFCQKLMEEVDHFERHIKRAKLKIMRPNTMNQFGVVLDDFGMEAMLQSFMETFIRPLSEVFFTEFGGSSLESHHGYVVEYGTNRDLDLGFHVDDAEVTLNVCLGKQFSGGELYFRGVRCDNHVNSQIQSEEIFDYSHVPGQAVLHSGRHRHGVRPTTSGHRLNLIIWCRSSVHRETKRYQKEFPTWCAECKRQRKERIRARIASASQNFFGMRP
ncbi:hypothetical protein RIF29_22572 [Crotalaria pallida]|uniref:Fe2OG dioxygenase domain-containing protein n=1 Tax=Crotalaria pallida TaxID=3830 RepID=A0AAN9F564_CROPI